jgi:hypothetical protein
MKLFLHIGAHKTGTSLVQRYLADHAKLIHANRLDFTRRSTTDGYFGWGEPSFLEENVVRLMKVLDGPRRLLFPTYIASHEDTLGPPFVPGKPGLYPQAAESARTLQKLLGKYRPTVIYYIRSQEQFLESYYLQTIHVGGDTPFRDWLAGINAAAISWVPVIAALKSAFGENAVVVKDFGEEMKHGQSEYLRSFFEVVVPGLKPSRFLNFRYAKIKNPSVGDRGLAIALAANRYLESDEERRLMRRFLQMHFSNQNLPRPDLLTADEQERIRSIYAEENRSLITPRLPAQSARGFGFAARLR